MPELRRVINAFSKRFSSFLESVVLVLALSGSIAAMAEVPYKKHSVPLEHIVFDTFDGGHIPLTEITPEIREKLRNRIIPLHDPRFVPEEEVSGLSNNDLVKVYEGKITAYAYPLKVLDYHEIVEHEVDGIPILVSYCPLCGSGVVYDRQFGGNVLSFGNTSALYENNMVMFDTHTQSLWVQVSGEAIAGELTGSSLRMLPSMTMQWKEWKDQNIPTQVLALDQQLGARFPYQFLSASEREPPPVWQLPFPLSKDRINEAIKPNTMVLTVQAGDNTEKAYPLNDLGNRATHDIIGGEPVVVFSFRRGPVGAAYSPLVNNRELTFRVEKSELFSSPEIRDEETGTLWTIAGHATEGPLQGSRLRPFPTRRAAWFSLSLTLDDIEIYKPAD